MKIQVAVFFGGRSVEHEISVISAMQAIAALDKNKYDPVPVYISKDGTLYTGEEFSHIESYKNMRKLLETGKHVSLVRNGGKVVLMPITKRIFGSDKPFVIDVALPVVHGTFTEDGSLQGYFEVVGLPYCGSDVFSSAVCMEKPATKAILREAGLPVLPEVVISQRSYADNPGQLLNSIESEFPYPVVVKPVNLGSSVGVAKAENRGKLERAIETAFQFSRRVMIEPAIVHLREINVSVLGGYSKARASVCEEPVGNDEVLSYHDKYQSGGKTKSAGMSSAQRIIPAAISHQQAQTVKEMAVGAFQALECYGVCRVDLLFDTLNSKFYINEINTIPGSLAFYLWEADNLRFPAMLDELIDLAFSRQRNRNSISYAIDTNILASANLIKGAKTNE